MANSSSMFKVVFVCLGNICRSPLAEGIFSHLIKDRGLEDLISCNSKGTGDYHIGAQPDHRSVLVAQEHRIVLNHQAQQFKKEDFDDYDLIIAMDQDNFKNINRKAKSQKDHEKVKLMMEYHKSSSMEVEDPYFGDIDSFRNCYYTLLPACQNLLDVLSQEVLKKY